VIFIIIIIIIIICYAKYEGSKPQYNKIMSEMLKMLMAQREMLEIEADAIHSELTSPGINGEPPAGIKDSLIDKEGYPRGDIDILNVKMKRKRLAEINTDYKAIMKKIEEAMHETFLKEKDKIHEKVTTKSPENSNNSAISLSPMAKLDEVLEGSPASMAGIMNGDLLIQFGAINKSNSSDNFFSAITKLVGESNGKIITVVIQRSNKQITLSLIPKTWSGRGLLGCHLTPLS
jgi:26S proteasome non-ATPase regulatory subunit 9